MSPDTSHPAVPVPVPATTRLRSLGERALVQLNRLRLPGASVLPVAGAVVGLYGGLAAGIFANLIGLVSGAVFGSPRLVEALRPHTAARTELLEAFARAHWRLDYLVAGVPLGLAALGLARLMRPGGARDLVRRRLRVLGLLGLGALSLYYPLVALAAVNSVLGREHDLLAALAAMPPWARLVVPALGGALVGRLLEKHPGTRGHGVPEVVAAVQRDPETLTARRGLRKLVASALTIGTGGSAGREGPIVYGGAAFGSAVGRTLGFTRRELSVLLAAGAGAGIAASFDTPIGGAIFALEIILREFELSVFSPIVLASVTATMVSRGVMGGGAMLARVEYRMESGWEILAYAALGLLMGLLAFAFVRLLHACEHLFEGHAAGPVSAWLGARSRPVRAAIGGLLVGALSFVSPTVWGVGHESLNLATAQKLSLAVLVLACALKLLATCLTLGSGGSGGTFFPAVVIGGLGGGAFGELLHRVAPHAVAHSGAYALVGMAGCVAGFTRGPLTGLMMMYELSGSTSAILPLMVTCSIASALCHRLVERRMPRALTEAEVLRRTPVRAALLPAEAVSGALRLRALFDRLVASEAGALPVLDEAGRAVGVVQLEDLRAVVQGEGLERLWRDDALDGVLVAFDVMHRAPVLTADATLLEALEAMDASDSDALAVVDPARAEAPHGVVTRASVQRAKRRALSAGTEAGRLAPTEST